MSESNLNSKQEKPSEEQPEEKRKRRPRSDEDGRNYSCSCGKSYLSYPALYTHIKTKHNGKVEAYKPPYSKSQLSEEKDEEEEFERTEDHKNMQNLKQYLNKLFPFTSKEKEGSTGSRRELSKDEVNLLKSMKDYWEKRKKEDEAQVCEAYATTIDHVLGRFLLQIEGELSRTGKMFIQEFVLDLREGLNELQSSQKHCKTASASYLPQQMNNWLARVFQTKEEGHLYSKHPTIPCKVIFHLCRWLFAQKFTNHSLKFNTL